MNLSTKSYKGARDFYPEDKRIQKYMFSVLRDTVESYGYQEYDAPIIEPTELYLSKSSDEIVSEQTYSFTDRGGRQVTLRPEMTPTVSRMVAGRRQEMAYPLRWYSIPDLWRYERPQAGRLRQHYQLNVDLFGLPGIEGDHEVISVADSILKNFGATSEMYEIHINSRQLINTIMIDCIGETADQVQAVIRLVDHRSKMPHQDFIDALSQIVSADKAMSLVEILSVTTFENLPEQYKDHPSVRSLLKLKSLLARSGTLNIKDDLSLMRGFDYYTDIVFEVFDTHPENGRSMFGGGRYDGLVGLFGVEPVATVGFGMGDVTLQRFLELHKLLPDLSLEENLISIILVGDIYEVAQPYLEKWRRAGVNIAVDATGRKLDVCLRHSAKSGAEAVVVLGEKELADKSFTVKSFKTGKEARITFQQLEKGLKSTLRNA